MSRVVSHDVKMCDEDLVVVDIKEAPVVSSTSSPAASTMQEKEDDDDRHQPPGQDDESVENEEESDYCYESDYEYHEDDGSVDDLQNAKPSFKKVKTGNDGNKEAFQSSSGILSSEYGMDDLPTPSYVPAVASMPKDDRMADASGNSVGNFRRGTTGTVSLYNNHTFCGMCQDQEDHTPVVDCEMVREWRDAMNDDGRGILDVAPGLLQHAMRNRVAECHDLLHNTIRRSDGWPLSAEQLQGGSRPDRQPLPRSNRALQLFEQEGGRDERLQRLRLQEIRRRRGFLDGMLAQGQQQLWEGPANPLPGQVRLPPLPPLERLLEGLDNPLPPPLAANDPLPVYVQLEEDRANQFFAHKTMEVVATDLRAFHWDIQAWRNAMQVRRLLEADWLATHNTRVGDRNRIENEILNLGLDPMMMIPEDGPENEEPVRAPATLVRQRVLQDHDAFMRETMGDTPNANREESLTVPLAGPEGDSVVSRLVPNFLRAMCGMNEAEDATENVPNGMVFVDNDSGGGNDEHGWTCPICFDDDVDPVDRLSVTFPSGRQDGQVDSCDHLYCRDCWTGYTHAWLEEVRGQGGGVLTARLFCPHPRCAAVVTREHMERVVGESNSHPLLELHDQLALNSFVQGHRPTTRWCPGPNCEQIMIRCGITTFAPRQNDENTNGCFTHCSTCDTDFCFHCGSSRDEHINHTGTLRCPTFFPDEEDEIVVAQVPVPTAGNNNIPQPDADLRATDPRHQDRRGANAPPLPPDPNDTDKKIRRCPSCSTPIEKNGGCAHMHCKCGHHFCWLCMADMTRDTGHYCGREDAGPIFLNNRRYLRDTTLPRMDLDYLLDSLQGNDVGGESYNELVIKRRKLYRFAHVFNRYFFHDQGQHFSETQCECLISRAANYSQISTPEKATDTDFFHLANERLIACRRILKYSYCLLFYKLQPTASSGSVEGEEYPTDNAASSSLPVSLALFLEHQERLERMTERLSFLSENALTPEDRAVVVDMMETVERCIKAVIDLAFEQTS